jgi:hypothetical protein
MRVWRKRIHNLVLCIIIVLFSTQWSTAGGSAFELVVVNTGQVISCDKLRLDPGSFRCKHDDVTYKYDADAIESVNFDGEAIYPYDTVVLTESDLYEKDCEYLIKTIKGPLILENDPDLFILVGIMYEKGICTRQNVQQAYTYYRRAGKPGMKKYNDLRRRSS